MTKAEPLGLKPINVRVFFPADMNVGPDRARWYLEGAIRGWWQQFATENDPIREMKRATVVFPAPPAPPAPREAEPLGLSEERKDVLRDTIRRCILAIEAGTADGWWYEDKSRAEHELRQIEEADRASKCAHDWRSRFAASPYCSKCRMVLGTNGETYRDPMEEAREIAKARTPSLWLSEEDRGLIEPLARALRKCWREDHGSYLDLVATALRFLAAARSQPKAVETTDEWILEALAKVGRGEAATPCEEAAGHGYELGWRDGLHTRTARSQPIGVVEIQFERPESRSAHLVKGASGPPISDGKGEP